jgi:hypothetical protein
MYQGKQEFDKADVFIHPLAIAIRINYDILTIAKLSNMYYYLVKHIISSCTAFIPGEQISKVSGYCIRDKN